MCQLLESGNRSTFRAPTLLQLFSTWHSLKSWKTKRIAVLLQLFCWSTAAGTLHGSQNESYDRVVALGCFEWNCKTCSSSARLLFWGFGFWLEPDWDRDRCWEVSCRCRRIIALERDSIDCKCVFGFRRGIARIQCYRRLSHFELWPARWRVVVGFLRAIGGKNNRDSRIVCFFLQLFWVCFIPSTRFSECLDFRFHWFVFWFSVYSTTSIC